MIDLQCRWPGAKFDFKDGCGLFVCLSACGCRGCERAGQCDVSAHRHRESQRVCSFHAEPWWKPIIAAKSRELMLWHIAVDTFLGSQRPFLKGAVLGARVLDRAAGNRIRKLEQQQRSASTAFASCSLLAGRKLGFAVACRRHAFASPSRIAGRSIPGFGTQPFQAGMRGRESLPAPDQWKASAIIFRPNWISSTMTVWGRPG